MLRFFVTCFFLSFFLLFGACSSDSGSHSDHSAAIAEGRALIREIMEETGAMSISVALVDGERVIWSEAFGVANRETAQSAARDTLYSACSISKVLATVAVMILVDQGRISLDDPLIRHLPDFSMPLDERYKGITVRMLLNHSSGLPGYEPGEVSLSPIPDYAARMLGGLKSLRLIHEPGSINTYNNNGFTMVENLIMAVTGMTYPEFVRKEILEPLGMQASQFQDSPLPDAAYARAYDGEKPLHLYTFNVYASGGLYTTPEELARLAMMALRKGTFGSHRLLSAHSLSAMAQDQREATFNPVPYEDFRFGLGWDTVAQPGMAKLGVMAWQKGGDFDGMYSTNMLVLPEDNLAVVVFGASGSRSTQFTLSHAVKISNRILLRALVERGRLERMPEPLSGESLPVQAVPEEERKVFAGFYASSHGVLRLSYEADDSITLEVFGADWAPIYQNLRLRSDGWYAADGEPVAALRTLTVGENRYIALRERGASDHYSYTTLVGQGLDAESSISSAWAARLGAIWLPVNQALYVHFPVKTESPGFRLRTITGLNGYLYGNKILRDMRPASPGRLDGMFLTVPDSVREMQDVALEDWRGEEWLRVGSYLYRPLSGVPLLSKGETAVTIGKEAFAEWFRLPSSGMLSVTGAKFWIRYDDSVTEVASGSQNMSINLSESGAAYLLLYGEEGETILFNLTEG